MRRWALLAVVAACGGGGDDPLTNDADVPHWANSVSAMGAYEVVREPVAFFDDAFTYEDAACPVATRDATSATITGECTDDKGRVWTGTATVVRDGTTITVDMSGFGNDAFGGALRAEGTVVITELGPDMHAFDVDVTTRGGITSIIDYSGTVAGTYTGPTTWNGSGAVSKSGDFFNGGTVTGATVDQVRDNDGCPGEGFSGTTTMSSPAHVVVITYDGATACDPDHSARWSRDGEDQGIIAGITCSAGGAVGLAPVLAVLGLVFRRRRKNRE